MTDWHSLTDTELAEKVVELSEMESPSPLSSKSITDILKKLDIKCPSLLVEILKVANGGETILARSESILPSIPNLTPNDMWKKIFEPIAVQCEKPEIAHQYIGKLLPLGDDYGGDIIAIDLRSGPDYRVLTSVNHKFDSFSDWEEIASSFKEFVIDSIEITLEEPQAPPVQKILPDSDQAAAKEMGALLTKNNLKVTLVENLDPAKRIRFWTKVESDDFPNFLFRFNRQSTPLSQFGCLRFSSRGGPLHVFIENNKFREQTFLNAFKANDHANLFQPQRKVIDPFSFDRIKVTKASENIYIIATDYTTNLQPTVAGVQSLGVFLLHEGAVHNLRFDIQTLLDPRHADNACRALLQFGYDWLGVASMQTL